MTNGQIKGIIGQRVRYYRKMQGMTQKELAAKVNADSTYITNIEKGQKGISVEKLVEICTIFNISVSDLLPMEAQNDTEAKEEIIEEILLLLKTLETPQLRMYKTILNKTTH